MIATSSPIGRRTLLAAAALAAAGPGLAAAAAFPVVELRQYTCRKGRRDALIELFEREFIASQDAVGAHVLATFRDRGDPDRFVWMRGFESLAARTAALETFYGGHVWAAHRGAANPTMLDSDNVLLLKPAGTPRPLHGGAEMLAFIHYLTEPQVAPFTDFFEAYMQSVLVAAGLSPGAAFVRETRPNTFPRLPVREGEQVFVWFASGGDRELARYRAMSGWRDAAPEALLPAFMRQPEVLRLSSTAGSPLTRN